jgi:prepilin-type N-terminal cleavage/methylation domain-containing protein/prepilin-type processing-associated H-X9-DG protein
MATRYRAAFTLVELLVVIAIIATLMGLLLPAVLGAKIRSQIATCANNQAQLGKAMIAYEIETKRLPGYANKIGGATVVGWAPLLLPYIGHNDLWEGTTGNNGWRSATTSALSTVNLFVCPSDAPPSDGYYPLSYIVNAGYLDTSLTPNVNLPSDNTAGTSTTDYETQRGLFRNFTLQNQSGTVRQLAMTDVPSASRRPMIAELAATRQWSDFDVISSSSGGSTAVAPAPGFSALRVTAAQLGFVWPNTPVSVASQLLPIHNGVVNVTFCDGHTEGLTDDTDPSKVCGAYDCTALP